MTKMKVGDTYNRLTVLELIPGNFKPGTKRVDSAALVECICGTIKTVSRGALTSGNTKSCGCLDREKSSARMKAWRPNFNGEDSPTWIGDDITYRGLHKRIRSQRGLPSDYTCPCGEMARQWAYQWDKGCESENLSPTGVAYCPHVEHYAPLCVACHKALDGARSVTT
jgi:hypothetical protein